ncbi:MAG TPA: gamma-glutamyl-gamma-aminobutyrate hydrolase family protein [Acidimicrobiales bacterium]|nr:gamma-glutamyl-gamma-aminobutyrate hydrolase family protein [Acidimicrobiales bacterium]
MTLGRGGVPTVALTMGRSPAARYSVHRGYLEALWDLGANVALLAAGPGAGMEQALDLVRACDAVLLTGGPDVDPSVYGAQPTGLEKDCDPERDAIEVAAVHCALEEGKRVLGICRGMQLVTAALGGRLVADLPAAGYCGHDAEERESSRVHGVAAAPGSLAHEVLVGMGMVNSIHHQAVLDSGEQLEVSARADDGVVEAVEAEGVLGIQWHPERLPRDDIGRLAPFRWLVGA